ncbi:MAG: phage tail sheath family protein [Clostridiales bacterium]|nr:phage tail sheath family protein [Clostridiales bacterium]
MANTHGVFIQEEATAVVVPQTCDSAVQVVIGTAPVNMADDPSAMVNVPVLANSATEAMAALGYVKDFQNYTLCQTMYITSSLYQVEPVVYINVLDPSTHKKAMDAQTVTVSDMQATVELTGVIKDGLAMANGDATLEEGADYTLAFDSDGYLVITLIADGAGESATELTVTGNVLDPSAVTAEDIIGAYNASTGAETGMEVIRQVYPKLGVVPGILIAPGFSQVAEVGIALAAKAANINGVFKAMAFLDIDTEQAKLYTDVKTVKEDSGFTSEFCYNIWPCCEVGDYIFAGSAIAAARTAYNDADNEDVPSASPSNKTLSITGTCLADGTEVALDQDQATTVGEYGVATFVNINGYRLWGNHTGAYPSSSDAKDIWINVRRMFNWQGNNFILTYFDKVDDPMNNVLIENIVDSENIRCAAYAPTHWAGASIEYLSADNPTTDILAGKMTFRQHIAPYTPAETITNILDYDTDTLTEALTGGE